MMSLTNQKIKNIIESALFAAGHPLPLDKIAELFLEHEAPLRSVLKNILHELEIDYQDRGVQLVEVASGYRFQSKDEYAEWLQRLWDERPSKYSRASLETLALIAYRQPVTRAEIEEIRGVSVSSNIIKSLMEREWIRVVGHRDVPGRPSLFATTRTFLDYFNLKSLDSLPSLAEIRDIESLTPQFELTDKHIDEVPNKKLEQNNSDEFATEDDEVDNEDTQEPLPSEIEKDRDE